MLEPLDAELDARLAALFPPDSVFAVGGRVRDELRASHEPGVVPAKDLDYVVVGLEFGEVVERLSRGGKADLVGAAFAVVKWTIGGRTVDVALARREASTGTGHRDFALGFGPGVTLEEDLGRRDFRMNMLARAIPSKRLVDPFLGARDIAARRIDVLRPAAFREDPLRMLRACQFAARFEYAISPPAFAGIAADAPLVATVSQERVGEELTKLLVRSRRPSLGIELMRETGLLSWIWPELLEGVAVEQNEWHAYDVYRHALVTLDAVREPDLILRLAALLHDVGKPRVKDGPHFYRHEHVGEAMALAMLERFRFPREVSNAVAQLVAAHMYVADPEASPAALRRFVRRVGVPALKRLFALRQADITGSGLPKRDASNERFQARIQSVLEEKPPFSVRDLAIDGQDVIQAAVRSGAVSAGFRGDRRVGEVLAALFEQVTDDPRKNTRPQLEALLDRMIGERFGTQGTRTGEAD